MSELATKARIFAVKAHEGVTRNNIAKRPFIMHPAEVVDLVYDSHGNEREIVAAWLHDTVEDTSVTLDDIRLNFGDEVAELVNGLTDSPEFSKLLLLERKICQAARVRGESWSVKRVKIADQISNVRMVAVDPPSDWDTDMCLKYIAGAKLIAFECRGGERIP